MRDSIKNQVLRSAAVRYAEAFIGLPYIWGGDDPIKGFDCSGLVIEIFTAIGILPHRFDATADVLYERWKPGLVERGYAGCAVFWFTEGKATHVELMIDEFHTIGASGGGSSTTSEEQAAVQNAYVKMRPVGYRGTNFKIVDPLSGGQQ